jgi:hypothetical protein
VFNTVAFVSLLLLVVMMALWIRSYEIADRWRVDYVGKPWRADAAGLLERNANFIDIQSEKGGIFLQFYRHAHAPLNLLVATPGWVLSHVSAAAQHYPGIEMLGETDIKEATTYSYGRFALGWYHDPYDRPYDEYLTERGVVVPQAWLTAIAAFLPTIKALHVYRRRLKLRERRTAICRACGYNLTANVSGICPECGTSAADK